MSSIIKSRAVVAVVAAAVVLAAAGCSSTETGTGTPVATTKDLSALLGPANPATGAPIKIGLIDDGKTIGIDHTPIVAAFNATVQYANEHLGGINGHKIEVEECSTNNTPNDATGCGVKLSQDKVAAVLVPVSAQDTSVYKALTGSGIPYFTYAAGSQEIIAGPGAFLLVNPIATLAAPAKIAKDNGVKKAAIVIIDVPAVAPLTAIAKPIYEKAGVELNVVPISPQTADLTPAIQQAMSDGAQQFSVIGTDEFNTSGIKTLKQLGFEGKIVMVTAPTQTIVDNVPGGLEGVIYITTATSDPNDKDVQLYNAVMDQYMQKDVTPSAQSAWSFALVLGFVNAIKGQDAAVDAPTVATAIKSMPQPLPLPLGGGLTYQCGAKVVSLLPNVCTNNALWTTLDAQGQGQKYEQLDVSSYMPGA